MAVVSQLIITGFLFYFIHLFIYLSFFFFWIFFFSFLSLLPIPQGLVGGTDTGKGKSFLMCPKKFGAGEERNVLDDIHAR